ncbi:MAG: hypothetical protein ACKVOB_02170 [Sphingomonas sp.]
MDTDLTAQSAARDDLMRRVTALSQRAAFSPGPSTADLAREIDQIRAIAQANGMYPAASVAHALESALARGERGPLVRGWLALLRDATCSDRHDADACASFAAACSVRLAR